jgi:Prolyl oligopeptidase family
MAIVVSCPSCERNIKAKDELAGKKIKCAGCGELIPLPNQRKSGIAASSRADHDEDEIRGSKDELEERSRRTKKPRKKKKQTKSNFLLLGVIGGGAAFVLLVALMVAGVMFFGGRNQGGGGGSSNLNGPGAQGPAPAPGKKQSLAEARQGFVTKNLRPTAREGPLPEPPANIFLKTKFDSPVGKLSTYLTPDPRDGKKHPAIIWITGGDCNSIDDSIWQPAPPQNDQTASEFRKAGIVMMYPSLRGGNDNPGQREGYLGEVNDILAAADFLEKQNYVDPRRIYLGGHSTGGTVVLLTGEYSDRFRAVFSFGPVAVPNSYPPQFMPFDVANPRELELRSPIRWLDGIKSPVFVLEGATGEGNIDSVAAMRRATTNPNIRFFNVTGANHFSILLPATRFLSQKILADNGEKCNIDFQNGDLEKLFRK